MEKELIKHIAEQLSKHEEMYAEGAWERFSEREEKKRGLVWWPWASVAALLLLSAGLYFGLQKSSNPIQNITKTTNKTPQNNPAGIKKQENTAAPGDHIVAPILPKDVQTIESTAVVVASKLEYIKDSENTVARGLEAQDTVSKESYLLANTIYRPSLNTIQSSNQFNGIVFNKPTESQHKETKLTTKPTFEEILAYDSQKPVSVVTKNKSTSKWEPAVYVAPAMGNDNKVNMNYGFQLSYAVAKKIAISSGIAYSTLSGSESINSQSTLNAFSSRNLESINTSVSGLNIPLELRYNITDNLYTGIGVSAMAVLNSKQQSNYVTSQFSDAALMSPSSFNAASNLVTKERSVEPVKESTIDPNMYIGFYNFSIGFKQKISPKKNISFEPFFRLPMKTLSTENLNLTNGGLRLKLDF
ncbi:hypothetical protein [Pedobacter sp. MW01-1-1]|uniref:hypothetical protein n=1 Tax=Pedobacter sp. MW01-1-1 TaxID=3383027 RepID=UPI003FF05B3A